MRISDWSSDVCSSDLNVFQSTHPYRVRRMNCARPWAPAPVSIHAPVQGATIGRHIRLQFETSFQSTHPYRVRRMPPFLPPGAYMFQSTHPYRVRRADGADDAPNAQVRSEERRDGKE